MKCSFLIRGKEVAWTVVEQAVAVRPTVELRRRLRKLKSRMIQRFGGRARDDEEVGGFGLNLPSRNRGLFEKAGWLFIEPRVAVARAVFSRARVKDAEAACPVLISPSGSIAVATEWVTVQLSPALSDKEVRQRLKSAGLSRARRLRFAANTFEARLPRGQTFQDAIAELQDSSDFIFAEPSLLEPIVGRSLQPVTEQWQHFRNSAPVGTPGPGIDSITAWVRTRGREPGSGRPVRIAVIDNGMHVGHPGLSEGIVDGGHFRGTGTGTGTPGFIRYRPRRGTADFPTNAHGTFCLGVAGARMNERGVYGSAPEADLIAIACLPDQIGTQTTLARAIALAADPSTEDGRRGSRQGADVISISLGPNEADWIMLGVLEEAIHFATQQGRTGRGVPLFWAVSNGEFSLDRDQVGSHPSVIAVGRSNWQDQADGSAYGSELDFLTPGTNVLSTSEPDGHARGTGTSYAAPLAAGVAALVLAVHPDWTADQVRTRLRETCDKIGGVSYDSRGHHPQYGFGRIHAAAAVR